MQFQDYYKTLDVERSSSGPEIQKAYRRLARKYHPDLNRDDEEAENRFKEIGEAYEVLGDESKRKRYDQYGSAWKQAQKTGSNPNGWGNVDFNFADASSPGQGFDFGSSGFSSFFDMLFGQQGRPHWNRQRGAAAPPEAGFGSRRGSDREAILRVALTDLANGAKKKISIMDPANGQRRSLEVSVPKGVLPGQKIRLADQGEAGSNGQPGDLFLTIELLPNPQFELDGRTLRVKLPLTPWEAALGAKVSVPTLDGKVDIKVPAGTSSGRKIRLRGKGLPNPKGSDGDLIVELQINVPGSLSDEEVELYGRLAEVSAFRPRDS